MGILIVKTVKINVGYLLDITMAILLPLVCYFKPN